MSTRHLLATTILAAMSVLAFAQAGQASTIAALTGNDTITVFDTDTKKAGKTMKVTGISGALAGIDVRPADGMLYGLVRDGTVVTINTTTGAATVKSKLETMVPMGVDVTVDFNPVADRMRVIGSDGMNLRANVDDGKVTVDGKLKFAETDTNAGKMPSIMAGAYINSVKGAKETTLYDVDGKLGMLFKQAPPNDGILVTTGNLGLNSPIAGFDIESDGTTNTGWAYAGGMLYKVDLASAKAMSVGKIDGLNGTVRDIAVMPKM